MTNECDIVVGDINEYSSPPTYGKWWWRIDAWGCTFTGDKEDYKSKRSAVRAARRVAKRYDLMVKSVCDEADD